MNGNISIKAHVGHYTVSVVDRLGVRIHHVGKDRRCTCGGTDRTQCAHIRAVVAYLKKGGSRAPEPASLALRDDGSPAAPVCPLCGLPVKSLGHEFWRCPRDSSHYWAWRGERNGAAVRKFLTQPHSVKQGAFYEQTIEEREAFLEVVKRRMYADGYNPHT